MVIREVELDYKGGCPRQLPGVIFMFCINPICIEERGIFPCGQCRFCRMMRSNVWAMRMVHEGEYWNEKSFLTLTYDNEHLNEKAELCKRDLQLFIKMLRKSIEPKRLKYFACGEYGERFGRPHYHMIIFGIGVNDCNIKLIEKIWGKGFIYLKDFNRKNCRYVTKYVTKAPLGRSKRDVERFPRAIEFQVQSRGIGLSWIMENFKSVGERGILYHGRQVTLPRYYVEKGRSAGMSDQVIADVKCDAMQRSIESYRAYLAAGLSGDDVKRIHENQKLQRICDLMARDGLYSGNDDQ